jgi:hypothetical protein
LDAAIESRVAAILESGPRAVRAQKALIQAWEGLSPEMAITQGIEVFVASWETDEPSRMMGGFLDVMRRRRRAAANGA